MRRDSGEFRCIYIPAIPNSDNRKNAGGKNAGLPELLRLYSRESADVISDSGVCHPSHPEEMPKVGYIRDSCNSGLRRMRRRDSSEFGCIDIPAIPNSDNRKNAEGKNAWLQELLRQELLRRRLRCPSSPADRRRGLRGPPKTRNPVIGRRGTGKCPAEDLAISAVAAAGNHKEWSGRV
jgi:hypothetical protein